MMGLLAGRWTRVSRMLLAVAVVVATTSCADQEASAPVPRPYLYFGEIDTLEGLDAKLDGQGVPVIRYGEEAPWQHNPVTIAQWGLAEGSRGETASLLRAADWLVNNQAAGGAWTYDFEYYVPSADQTLTAGWTSAMAQGNALSVLARAWEVSGRERYRVAGDRALQPIARPVARGGLSRTWRGHLWFEEYPTEKPSLVLNGFLFTLIGIREYADATGSTTGDRLWSAAEPSAAALIDDFDLGKDGASAYALAHKDRAVDVFPAGGVYLRIHVELAREMADLTGRPVYAKMAEDWAQAMPPGDE